ncbi:MAG: AraC family transcriptional regulator [Kordiimonadaceae bacterium]|nr:AraC family transcriptional regulator [Kordiimonadaceae bacterium]MBO6568822.1 AraC family transcriptional regulator [Kordiimonadaceae bacterium]MBO6965203.1 AraC family transcriptional regulator [Kordiimonadaceae bacterium]
MEGSFNLQIPARELINVVTMSVSLLVALSLAAPVFRRLSETKFLALALSTIVVIKLDQLYQMLGGLQAYPAWGFVLTPFQWLMTPALYALVLSKTQDDFELKRKHFIHLLPSFLSFLYLFFTYFSLPVEEKVNLIAAGWLALPINRVFIPVAGDLVQLGYLVAALRIFEAHGIALRSWFSNIEDREYRWLKRIVSLWILIFSAHLAWVIAAASGVQISFIRSILDVMNFLHLLIALALPIAVLQDRFVLKVGQRMGTHSEKLVLSAGALNIDVRSEYFGKLQSHMKSSTPFLDPNLTLQLLADQLALTARELSEVINREAGTNFFDFINSYRIDHAKELIASPSNKRILDIGLEAGFNSKSAFNDAFKRRVGITPTAYRKSVKKTS